MREMLFRGKRKDNDEWVEGYLFIKYFQEIPHGRFVVQYKPNQNSKKWQPEYAAEEIDPETVGQYTGLTDKNGKKIFEGDIVWDEYQEAYAEILYEEETAMFSIQFDSWCTDFDHYASIDIEVIGNIHDSPELLKGANDNG